MTTLSSPAELRQRGIFNAKTLEDSLDEKIEFVVDGLITAPSVNMIAGDSGIGKTPLCLMLALAIAAGIPFFGMKVPRPRRVLYCDAESTKANFFKILNQLSKFMGFKTIPKNFHVWSPNWDDSLHSITYDVNLFARASWNGFQPEVIFVDPLRVFFPEADSKREVSMGMIKKMRQLNAPNYQTWFLIHHIRKPQVKQDLRPPPIEDDPHRWFHEVAGTHSIVNHVDTRLGLEIAPTTREGSELTLGGFVRMLGPINPIYLARDYDNDGEPKGYVKASSMTLLSSKYRETFDKLPPAGQVFTFSEATKALGQSDASANNMLKRFLSLSAVKRVPGKGYTKLHN